jgi:hypothetical protein
MRELAALKSTRRKGDHQTSHFFRSVYFLKQFVKKVPHEINRVPLLFVDSDIGLDPMPFEMLVCHTVNPTMWS